MKSHLCAGGVVLIEGKIVALQRYNGVWLFPKGHIDPGETAEQAALREVKEETGLECRIVKPLGITSYNFKEKEQLQQKTVHWYLMLKEKGQLCKEEKIFSEIKLVPENEINTLTFIHDRELAMKAWQWWRGERK